MLGIYRRTGILKTAYDKAVRELEAEQKDVGSPKKIIVNTFNELTNVWQYDIDLKKLFGVKHFQNVIVECVMDSP